VKDLLLGIEFVHFQDGMAYVLEVSAWNGNVTLQAFKQRKWLGFSFEITMNVKGEVSKAKGMEIIVNINHDLEEMAKIQNVNNGKLKNLELEVSIPQSHITCSLQRARVVAVFKRLFLPVIQCKIY
jgi:hypothetical protein